MAPSISRFSTVADLTPSILYDRNTFPVRPPDKRQGILEATELQLSKETSLVEGVKALGKGEEIRRLGLYQCLDCDHTWASAQTRCIYRRFTTSKLVDKDGEKYPHTDATGHVFKPAKDARQACFNCETYKLPYESQPLGCKVIGDFKCDCGRSWSSKNTMLYQQYDDFSYQMTADTAQECYACGTSVLPFEVEEGGQTGTSRAHKSKLCERCCSGQYCTSPSRQDRGKATVSKTN